MRGARRNQRGFTLIELLAVVTIIGVLALLAVPKVFQAINTSKDNKGRGDLPVIAAALDQYYMDNGFYPTKLDVLIQKGYIKNLSFKNAWGHFYLYAVDTNKAGQTAQAYVLADPKNKPEAGMVLGKKNKTSAGVAPDQVAPAWRDPDGANKLTLLDNNDTVMDGATITTLSGFRSDIVTE